MPDARANQHTRELLQERRRLTKPLRDIPSLPTADLADVESEESAMTEGILEIYSNAWQRNRKKNCKMKLRPQDTQEGNSRSWSL